MKLYSKYIAFAYLKYIFILFVALEFFYVGIDILANLKDLPQSASLKLLYVGLTATCAITYTLPLSLIFALIIMKFNMIRSNEMVSFYALGVSKNALILTPFVISLIITCGYIFLNTTPFAYASEVQKNITHFGQVGRTSKNMLLKYDGKYIFINELNPLANSAVGVKIFDIKNGNLKEKISAKDAFYNKSRWRLKDINQTILPDEIKPAGIGLIQNKINEKDTLSGFEPKTIESVYDSGNTYTIKEAIDSIKLFDNQGVNVNGIKASLYNMVFFPFFAPLMVLILYYYLPVTGRFFNLALLSFGFFIVTLCVWGMLFVLIRFSLNGVIIPEFGIILPILFLLLFGLYLVNKHS